MTDHHVKFPNRNEPARARHRRQSEDEGLLGEPIPETRRLSLTLTNHFGWTTLVKCQVGDGSVSKYPKYPQIVEYHEKPERNGPNYQKVTYVLYVNDNLGTEIKSKHDVSRPGLLKGTEEKVKDVGMLQTVESYLRHRMPSPPPPHTSKQVTLLESEPRSPTRDNRKRLVKSFYKNDAARSGQPSPSGDNMFRPIEGNENPVKVENYAMDKYHYEPEKTKKEAEDEMRKNMDNAKDNYGKTKKEAEDEMRKNMDNAKDNYGKTKAEMEDEMRKNAPTNAPTTWPGYNRAAAGAERGSERALFLNDTENGESRESRDKNYRYELEKKKKQKVEEEIKKNVPMSWEKYWKKDGTEKGSKGVVVLKDSEYGESSEGRDKKHQHVLEKKKKHEEEDEMQKNVPTTLQGYNRTAAGMEKDSEGVMDQDDNEYGESREGRNKNYERNGRPNFGWSIGSSSGSASEGSRDPSSSVEEYSYRTTSKNNRRGL